MKRALAIFMAFAMMTAALPVTVFAADSDSGIKVSVENAKEWESKEDAKAENPIPVNDAPQLRIEMLDTYVVDGEQEDFTFTLDFDTAEIDLEHLGIKAETGLTDDEKDILEDLVTIYDEDGSFLELEVIVADVDEEEPVEEITYTIKEVNGIDFGKGCVIHVDLPVYIQKTTLGTEATVAVVDCGFADSRRVAFAEIADIDDDDDVKEPYMKLDISKLQILEEDTVSYDTFGVDTVGRDFELDEIVTLTISEGFEFVPVAIHDHDGTVLQNVEWSADGKTVKVPVYKAYDTGFDMEAMTIKATTAEVGDEALLTVSAEHYPDVSKVIAKVVDEITETPDDDDEDQDDSREPYMKLDIPKLQVLEDGTVSYDTFGVDTRYRDFKLDEIVTLTISEGFEFVESPIHDHDGTILQNVEWSADGKTVKVPVYKAEDTGFDMEAMTIKATTAEVGDEALLTVSAEHYPDVSKVIAKVVDEITETPDDEEDDDKDDGREPYMFLDIPELQILKGGTVSYSQFNVSTRYRDFKLDEIVTLTISEGFEFVPSAIHDHDGTILQNVVWSADGKKVEVPVYKTYDTGFDMEAMTIKATTAKIGDEALLTVSAVNYPDVSQVIATVADPNALNCSISVDEIVKVEEGDSVTLEDVEIDAEGTDFTTSEILTLTLSEGFTFVTNAKIDTNQADIVSFTKDELVLQPKKTTDEIVIEDMEIKVTTAEVGDIARLAIVGDKRVSTGVKVAKVVDVADDTYMDVYVYGRKIVSLPKGGEVALRDVVIGMHDDDFDYKEEITLELNEGFEFVNLENISADYNNNGTLEEASSDELVIEAEKGVGKLVIEGVCIKATTAEAGDMAVLTAKHGQFEASTEAAEVVCSEIVLDVKAKTVKNGGKASFDVFGIDKTQGDVFAKGDEVTLTLSEGFAFVEGPVYDHDGTEILVKEWSKNKVVVYAPANPKHGFDMEGMTIHATSAKPGDVATVTASVDGYESVSKDVLTVVKASSGGGSSNKNNKTETKTEPKAEEPKVTTEETTTVAGKTTTVDTTSQTVVSVSQTEKEVYQKQLSEVVPAATAVGEGAYTFAVATSETSSDSAAGNTSGGTKDPEKISFDLSGQNVADPSHLTLVKYVTQPDGTVEVVKLGGTFDSAANTFSAYADGEGVYDLVHDPDVTKITFAIGQTDVSVNDTVKTNDVAPMLYNDKTMIPLRSIAEALGATVTWDELSKTVVMELDGQRLVLTVDGDTAMIHNDRTMVQLRYIGENFGAGVRWIPSTRSIEIVK